MRFLLSLLTRWQVPPTHGRHCRCCVVARWWNCPRCGRTFSKPTPNHACPGEPTPPARPAALAVTFNDGLDDLRAELSPLLQGLVVAGGVR
ncbi:hypothetical protein ACFO4E_08845 [Nocardiopsis mangrovi]|uniref:Uncharacterized protein n=1 Tax=Nocardiopsis mangrovi TaxID=1179818 RepID=A0ABV9DVJ6_9ACTN